MNTLEVDRFRADNNPVRLRKATAPPRRSDLMETVEVIDGRLIVIHPGLRLAPAGPANRSRDNRVLNFLETWRLELVKNGLARDGEPMAVREEFVSYLLNYKLDTLQVEIPHGAMRRFLDEWSHRWI